jgi:hypothetical protein
VLYLFSADCEALMPDVHAVRRAIIAGLRYRYARNVTSDRFAALVARLQETGPEARALWERHEVAIPPREYHLRVRSRASSGLRAGEHDHLSAITVTGRSAESGSPPPPGRGRSRAGGSVVLLGKLPAPIDAGGTQLPSSARAGNFRPAVQCAKSG